MKRATLASLDLRLLGYFVAVAEELHFGRAAVRLHISQPPLSAQIARLESLLGTRLFERTQRHVALTSSGRVLYGEATRLLAHAERVGEVMAGARAGRAGDLFLGCVPSGLFGALPAILAQRSGQPATPAIRVTEAHTADIIAAVLDGRLDAGLVWEDRAPPTLALRALERVRFIAAVQRGHPLASRKRVKLAELVDEPLIMPPRDITPHQFDRIHAGFRAAGLTPRIGQHVRSIAAQLGFVASGLGYALVPAYATKLAMEGIAFVPLQESLDSVPLSLIWNPARASSQLDAFRERVEQAFPVARVRLAATAS